MPEISVNGITLHYETAGEGPPLLLIAGLASDNASWAPIAPLLAPHATLIMPDNRGCGRTNDDGAEISMPAIAEDCAALLDHLGVEKAHVLGHSMGGVIAMTFAASFPGRVDRLVLAATSPKAPHRTGSVVDTLLALREAGLPESQWYRSFFHWLFRPSFFEDDRAVEAAIAMSRAYPYAQSAANMRRQIEAGRQFDAAAFAERIEAETLTLLAEEDLLFPPSLLGDAFREIRKNRLEILKNAGHSLHWDQSKAFADAVLAHLGDRPAK